MLKSDLELSLVPAGHQKQELSSVHTGTGTDSRIDEVASGEKDEWPAVVGNKIKKHSVQKNNQ